MEYVIENNVWNLSCGDNDNARQAVYVRQSKLLSALINITIREGGITVGSFIHFRHEGKQTDIKMDLSQVNGEYYLILYTDNKTDEYKIRIDEVLYSDIVRLATTVYYSK